MKYLFHNTPGGIYYKLNVSLADNYRGGLLDELSLVWF